MGKRLLGVLLVSLLGAWTMACSDDGDGGTSNTDAGTQEEINLDCPEKKGPLEGEYALKGECCYRKANSTRVEAQGDGDVVVEYRLNSIQTINHPKTIGVLQLNTLAQQRTENEEQSVLWRLTGPRVNGELVAGMGSAEIGTGRYNCDGTYSYYSSTAAPNNPPLTDPSRWAADSVPTKVDPVAFEDKAGNAIPVWSTNTNRQFAYTPYVNSNSFKLEWELVTQGYNIETAPATKEALDCIGSHREGIEGWNEGGTFQVYTQLALNDTQGIPALPSPQTYCQLVAFGVLDASTTPPQKDDPRFACDSERCEPGSSDCMWKKLPDSLCPENEAEMAIFGCHIGYEDNPDDEPTNCTQDAPTTPRDPDEGATDEGQCCDPLGKSTTLPACNSYMLRQAYVAAAADITDDLADELQSACTD